MINLKLTREELIQLYFAIQYSYNSTLEIKKTHPDGEDLASNLPAIESAYDKLGKWVEIHSPRDI